MDIQRVSGLQETLVTLISTATASAERGVVLPALILTYTGIDTMGWLSDPNPRAAVRQRFERWAERYMEPRKALGCTTTELYAARCGILHTATAESDLTEKGGERKVLYAWGSGATSFLQSVIDGDPTVNAVAVHAGKLVDAFRLGVAQCFEDAEQDAVLKQRLESRGAKMFVTVSRPAKAGHDGTAT